MLVQEPQSVSQSVSQEKIDKSAVPQIFCFYPIVVLECFYGLLLHISHVCQ